MERYAVRKLEEIFHSYQQEPIEYIGLYSQSAIKIVNAIKLHFPYENDFRNVFWKLQWNLNKKLNKEGAEHTLKKLFEGKWENAEHFVLASHDELNEEKACYRSQIRNKTFNRMFVTNQYSEGECNNNGSTGLTCPKCKSNNTTYSLLQTSRGDEGSTIFATCISCEYRWKFR